MNKLTQLLLAALLTINSAFTYKMFFMMEHLKESVAFDVDKARAQYEKDIKYVYQVGCRVGSDYVLFPKKQHETGEYDPDNPTAYCNQSMIEAEQSITLGVFKLGKDQNL